MKLGDEFHPSVHGRIESGECEEVAVGCVPDVGSIAVKSFCPFHLALWADTHSDEETLAQLGLTEGLGCLEVEHWRLSTDVDHQTRNPNYPYVDQPEPEDPGVVVRWRMDRGQYAIACGAYFRVRDNSRTVGP